MRYGEAAQIKFILGGKKPMKKVFAMALALAMVLSLCGCGSDGKYKVVKSLGSQEYSIGFRNGDSTYHYIDKALKELAYEGVIDEPAAVPG